MSLSGTDSTKYVCLETRRFWFFLHEKYVRKFEMIEIYKKYELAGWNLMNTEKLTLHYPLVIIHRILKFEDRNRSCSTVHRKE
jgi:hypothetical protein